MESFVGRHRGIKQIYIQVISEQYKGRRHSYQDKPGHHTFIKAQVCAMGELNNNHESLAGLLRRLYYDIHTPNLIRR